METELGRSDGSGMSAMGTTSHWEEAERISRTSMFGCASRLPSNSLIVDHVEPRVSECFGADTTSDVAACCCDPDSTSSLGSMVVLSASPTARKFSNLSRYKAEAINRIDSHS